ncbi:MAG: phosphoglucosamine mutase [Planctomycetes bacterium]|nr:phosphoglucosamine mutase [Planctomycetota bacterium]
MKPIRTLKISISGVRGIVGDSLGPMLLVRFAQAFGTYAGGGTIAVGRDTRTSGEMVSHAVIAGLLSTGCEVIDLGIAPVPTIQFYVRRSPSAGGIAITASHNPAEWNALKFIGPRGLFLDAAEARELLDIYHQSDYRRAETAALRAVARDASAIDRHIDEILRVLGPVPHHLRVAVDAVNGAASDASPRLLEALGCEVVPLHTTPDGRFPRPPEPVAENLKRLCAAVRRHRADVGFAQDADADRLAVVDERGRPLGEERTLALAAEYVLSRERGPVVINLSTSLAVEEIAARRHAKLFRTRIGEVNVTGKMEEVGAVFGGEGNGGVIWPRINFCRDSLVGMASILHLMAKRGAPISRISASLPRHAMVKRKLALPPIDVADLLARLREASREEGEWSDLDGLRFASGSSWWHVRPSNTEPAMRLVAEAKTERRARAIADRIERRIRAALHGSECA